MGVRGNKCIQSSTGSKAVNDGFFIIIMSEKENKQPVLQEGVYSKKNPKKPDRLNYTTIVYCVHQFSIKRQKNESSFVP